MQWIIRVCTGSVCTVVIHESYSRYHSLCMYVTGVTYTRQPQSHRRGASGRGGGRGEGKKGWKGGRWGRWGRGGPVGGDGMGTIRVHMIPRQACQRSGAHHPLSLVIEGYSTQEREKGWERVRLAWGSPFRTFYRPGRTPLKYLL